MARASGLRPRINSSPGSTAAPSGSVLQAALWISPSSCPVAQPRRAEKLDRLSPWNIPERPNGSAGHWAAEWPATRRAGPASGARRPSCPHGPGLHEIPRRRRASRRSESQQAADVGRAEQQKGDDRPRDQPEDGPIPRIRRDSRRRSNGEPLLNTVGCDSSRTNPGCPLQRPGCSGTTVRLDCDCVARDRPRTYTILLRTARGGIEAGRVALASGGRLPGFTFLGSHAAGWGFLSLCPPCLWAAEACYDSRVQPNSAHKQARERGNQLAERPSARGEGPHCPDQGTFMP